MRKLYLLLSVFTLMFGLSSCTVNWFDEKIEVPWWMIAIPTAVFVILVLVITGKYFSKQIYVCPKCNKEFHPDWKKAALSLHVNSDRMFKCPHCGKTSMCYLSYKNKK